MAALRKEESNWVGARNLFREEGEAHNINRSGPMGELPAHCLPVPHPENGVKSPTDNIHEANRRGQIQRYVGIGTQIIREFEARDVKASVVELKDEQVLRVERDLEALPLSPMTCSASQSLAMLGCALI